MKLRNILTISISVLLCACGGATETPKNSGNAAIANVNANIQKSNTNNPLAVTTPNPEQLVNNAPTLTPVYKAYCAAMVKKDETAIRKFYTADTLKSFDEQMKAENIKTLSEFLENDQLTTEVCEVSNERIKGDKAVGKVKTKGYPNGYDVLFVNENGGWKMSTMDTKTAF